jgi:hypothetical protein
VAEEPPDSQQRHDERMRSSVPWTSTSVTAAFALATACEAFLVVGTQDRSVMTVTPWQDDPYHAWISLVVFALPMLLVVVALRSVGSLLPGARSSSAGRRRDLVRAGLVLDAFVAATVLDCWAAVALREHRGLWDARTTWLLVVLTLLTGALPVVVRLGLRDLRAARPQPDTDWVGDVLPRPLAAWVRRHDRVVFLGASVVAAMLIVGALAVGEGWTDPLLIAWALAVEVTCYYAFCVLTNAVLGFLDRPDRDRTLERAVVTGSLALQAAVAFHGQLEPVVGVGSPDGVPRLVEVTLAPGLLAFVVAMILLRFRPARPAPPAPGGRHPRPWGARS